MKWGLLGSRRLRIGIAVVLILAVLGVGIGQLVPFWDRKATVESAETTEGTITTATYGKNTYEITYRYTVDGTQYENSRVFPGPYPPGGVAGPQVLGQIPVYDTGETVTVYHAANDPSTAWLLTRESVVSRHVVYFFFSGLVALALLTYIYVELKLPDLASGGSANGQTAGTGVAGETQATAAGGDGDSSASGEAAVTPGELQDVMTDVMMGGSQPSQAEIEQAVADRLPEETVERARGSDGELDLQRLQNEMPDHSGQPVGGMGGGGGGGVFGLLNRVFALGKRVAVVVGVGLFTLLAVSFVLVQTLTV